MSTARPGVALRDLDAEITRILSDIATNGVTERELTRVKNGMRASMTDRLSSVSGKAFQLSYYNYFTGIPDYMAQDLARYEQLTPALVQQAARRYLAGTPRVVLSIVPTGKKELALTTTTLGGIR